MWAGQHSLQQGWLKLLWSRRMLGWSIFLAGIACVLATLPLLNVLGYEFCFILSIGACVASIDLTRHWITTARNIRRPSDEQLCSAGGLTFALAISSTLLVLIPLLLPLGIISINALRVRNCDWVFGGQCFVLMPVLSAFLASALSLFTTLCIGKKSILTIVVPIALLLASVAASLFHFYNAPAVFSYNPIVGYFPGNLYDESIAFEAPFYWARFFQFSIALCALGVASMFLDTASLRLVRHRCPKGLRIWGLLITLSSAMTALFLGQHSGTLGFSVGLNDMFEALPGRYETKHFIIRYPLGGAIERDIALIAEDHEFRLSQVSRTLGEKPSKKITSFYFDSPATKHRLMGARNVYMAKPWRSEIYINAAPFPHPVLRHEIAHVVAGEFGGPIFRVSASGPADLPVKFNVGLIEGIAVAADWPDHFTRALTPHQSIKAMIELDMLPPIESLLSTGFFAFSSAQSYTVSGSFVRYLLDNYGIEPLKKVYQSGGNFLQAYGRSEKELVQSWYAEVSSITLPNGAAEIVRERFRRKSIFKRPCPHAVAKARSKMATLESKGQRYKAIRVADNLCEAVPEEPSYQIERSRIQIRAREETPASKTLRAIASDSEGVSSTLRAKALQILIDLNIRSARLTAARELLEEAQALPLEDGQARLFDVSQMILNDTGPSAPYLLSYLWGHRPELPTHPSVYLFRASEAARVDENFSLSHYLVARQIQGKGDPKATTEALIRAFDGGLLPLVEREAARMLAASAYRVEDFPAVEFAISIMSRAEQPEVIQLYAADWVERLRWKESTKSN